MSTHDSVGRLLRQNISIAQIAGYALANMVGLAIILTAIRFYTDIRGAASAPDSFISRDYIIVSKPVSGLGSILSDAEGFTPEEIADLGSQPWVERVGQFTASAFDVSARLDIAGRGMSTALFMESIPDEFFDVRPAGWNFTPERGPVPIIISKDYLALYNFGFAASRGLPQVSEEMMKMLPVKISVSGRGSQQMMDARIVGFSTRLNTIAVPESFMTWANERFGDRTLPPSRLIVETSSPGAPEISEYLAAHSYETSGNNAESGRAAFFLRVATGVVAGIGTVITLLSFFILTLSLWLLMHKNRPQIERLMLLGYTPQAVARLYYRLICAVNLAVYAAGAAIMLAAGAIWRPALASIGIEGSSPVAALLAGAIIMMLVTAANLLAVRRRVLTAFLPRQRS